MDKKQEKRDSAKVPDRESPVQAPKKAGRPPEKPRPAPPPGPVQRITADKVPPLEPQELPGTPPKRTRGPDQAPRKPKAPRGPDGAELPAVDQAADVQPAAPSSPAPAPAADVQPPAPTLSPDHRAELTAEALASTLDVLCAYLPPKLSAVEKQALRDAWKPVILLYQDRWFAHPAAPAVLVTVGIFSWRVADRVQRKHTAPAPTRKLADLPPPESKPEVKPA